MSVHPKRGISENRDPRRPWQLPPTIPRLEFEQTLGEVGIRELNRSTSRVVARVEAGERIVVWKRRNPVAVMFSATEAEDFLLIHAPALVRMRLEGREAHRRGDSIALEDML